MKILMKAKRKSQAVAMNRMDKKRQKYVTIKNLRKYPMHDPYTHHHGEEMEKRKLQLTLT